MCNDADLCVGTRCVLRNFHVFTRSRTNIINGGTALGIASRKDVAVEVYTFYRAHNRTRVRTSIFNYLT